jgi:hypothetical protein
LLLLLIQLYQKAGVLCIIGNSKFGQIDKLLRDFDDILYKADIISKTIIRNRLEPVSPAEIPETRDPKNHYFMQTLKNDCKPAYDAMLKALSSELVIFDENRQLFNFRCDSSCVGRFFKECGYTRHKYISQHILIDGNIAKADSVKNGATHTETEEWAGIEKSIFDKTV